MIKTLGYNFKIANEAIFQNKLRSFLTSLGIIFGVASVITMLAIGKGAEQEILEKMKVLGTNNIIIKPLTKQDKKDKEAEEDSDDATQQKEGGAKRFSPGLTIYDSESIQEIVPNVASVSPEVILERKAIRKRFNDRINLVGVQKSYFNNVDKHEIQGNLFHKEQYQLSEPVCIIGKDVAQKLFPTDKPIGKSLKVDGIWLKVIGVKGGRGVSNDNAKSLGVRNFDSDVYIPMTTMLMRFENRGKITSSDLQRGRRSRSSTAVNYHQLDQLVVRVAKTEQIRNTADIIKNVLVRKHNGVEDFELIIPELLLQQEQDTRQIFNFVLGAIASISLIVGGIGIMNIMLASVLERTKEIGIRMAVGAKKTDVMTQFLSEAVAISITGGVLGIIGGISASYIIELTTEISTMVSVWSVMISFFVSISVGLIFGILPAKKAANQDPIDLLRYE